MKEKIITSRSASRSITQDVAVCGLFTALIAVGAFIKIVIPVGADTINFTLQWLFVLLAGLLLGSKRAFRSVAVYLITDYPATRTLLWKHLFVLENLYQQPFAILQILGILLTIYLVSAL